MAPLPDLHGFTVLVIEDNPDSLELLVTSLTVCGARVLTATDTARARRHIGAGKVDLVLTDLALPGESGESFVNWLRSQPAGSGGSTAVVAVTAYPEAFPSARLRGFAAYIQKPLDLDNVAATISSILRPPFGRSGG